MKKPDVPSSQNSEHPQVRPEARPSAPSEGQPKKAFVEPKLKRHEALPDVTGLTF